MSLLDTIKELIPSKTVDVYGQSICIRPLSIEKIGIITPKLIDHWKSILNLGISFESISSEDNRSEVLKLVSYFVSNGVDVLEDISSVEAEAFKILPLDKSMDIISAVIEINLESFENMSKNWKSLTKILEEHQIDLSPMMTAKT